MMTIDPSRLDLAREYRRNPMGPYSPALQQVLKILHWDPADSRWIGVQVDPGGPWCLARTRGGRGVALDLYREREYATQAEIRWAVFQKRWQAHTGELPRVDSQGPASVRNAGPGADAADADAADAGHDAADPASGAVTPSDRVVRRTLTGYSDRFSVRPGETIAFNVSAEGGGDYDVRLVRLRCGDAANIGFRADAVDAKCNGRYPARVQSINAGSFVHVDADDLGGSLAFHALVWPTRPDAATQCVAGRYDVADGSGIAIGLDAHGALALFLGDGSNVQTVGTGVALGERRWYRIAVSVDVERRTAWLGQQPLDRYARDHTAASVETPLEFVPQTRAPLRLAAWSDSRGRRQDGTWLASAHYSGKLEAPAFHAAALTPAARDAFLADGTWPSPAVDLYAAWDFSRDVGAERVTDVSEHGRHGRTVNMPTLAMKGASWDGTAYDWQVRPEHYAAIHFHDDDLHDCGWTADFDWTVPADLASGLYAVQLTHSPGAGPESAGTAPAGAHDRSDGKIGPVPDTDVGGDPGFSRYSGSRMDPRHGADTLQDWIPFVVSPPVGTGNAPLALVLPSASYWAYANRGGIIDFPGREQVRNTFTMADSTALYLHHHPELGLSMYDTHSDGSGVCLSSRLRPVLSLRPNEALWQLPADTHLIDWLDALGFAYDVLTEDDLDTHGDQLLAPYRCVMTGTHPEYPSLAMLDAYAAFQARGGRFMYMGGNGFYWRVSYHSELAGIMEMRRGEDGIRAWLAEGGEYYHQFTGELGGMWRRMGRAPQSVAGTGMTAQGFDRSTYYLRTPSSHDSRVAFIFTGIGDDERIGDFGIIGGGAAGWEIDRADPALGTPPHALVVARADTFSPAYHWMKEELTHTHGAITGDTCPHVHCDMVFYETPNGGAVFSTSSIAWAGALAHDGYDNNVSRITANVVRRFLDPEPF